MADIKFCFRRGFPKTFKNIDSFKFVEREGVVIYRNNSNVGWVPLEEIKFVEIKGELKKEVTA